MVALTLPAGGCTRTASAPAVRFAGPVVDLIRRDDRRIVVIGASGWIGRTAIEALYGALGPEAFRERVICFGSSARTLSLVNGEPVPQAPLANLGNLSAWPSLVLHLAFLTKDKVGGMPEVDYLANNQLISNTVAAALEQIGADRLFVASSGAAAFANNASAAPDLRLYGRLKKADEDRFAEWADAASGRRAAIGRLYAVSGPFINKPETYALSDFILAALAGRPVQVHAPNAVYRSYVAVREVLSVVFALLLGEANNSRMRFDTGGEALEMGALAAEVVRVLGGRAERAKPTGDRENRYVGDHRRWLELLTALGLQHMPIELQIAETAAWLATSVSSPSRS